MHLNSYKKWFEALLHRNYNISMDVPMDTYHIQELKIDINDHSPAQLFLNIVLLINGYDEYHRKEVDQYGRLPFEASINHQLGIHRQNIVQGMIEEYLDYYRIGVKPQPSKVILSHDIDTLHSGFIYEFYRGLKTLDFPLMYRVLCSLAVKKSLWWNLDEIIDMLDRYDFKSIFYFITENGHSADGIKNADYDIKDTRIQTFIQKANSKGFEIGLHKSSINTDLNTEKSKLGNYCNSNRHHYLRYRIPKLYRALHHSDFKTDCSLAYPYNMGFRNGYGLPFQPLDLDTGETLDILEIPFQIMDRMFDCKTKMDVQKASSDIVDFIENNRENAVIGLLWHNTDLNDVSKKYSMETFKKVLKYLHEIELESVTPNEVLRSTKR